MIKRIIKAFGVWAIVTGFIYLIVDIWRSASSFTLSIRSLGQAWSEVSFESQIAVQVLFSNVLEQPQIWDFLAGVILRFVPAFTFMMLVGLLFYWLGKPKKPKETEQILAKEFMG